MENLLKLKSTLADFSS